MKSCMVCVTINVFLGMEQSLACVFNLCLFVPLDEHSDDKKLPPIEIVYVATGRSPKTARKDAGMHAFSLTSYLQNRLSCFKLPNIPKSMPCLYTAYSCVPNKRIVPNKSIGWQITQI